MGDEFQGIPPTRRNLADQEELHRYDVISGITAGVVAELDRRLERRLQPVMVKLDTLWDERNEERGEAKADKRWQAVLFGLGTLAGSLIGGVAAAAVGAYLQYRFTVPAGHLP